MLQGRGACLCTMMHWTPLPMEFPLILWHHCHTSRHCVWRVAAGALFSRGSIPSVTRAKLHVPSARARPQVFLTLEKAESVKHLDAVFGEAILPSWCVIVLRHCGHVTGAFVVFCPQKCRRQAYILSSTDMFFQCLAGGDPVYIQSILWDIYPFPCVAPLPPCSCKLLDETVKTFAVFSSWLYFLDGEDNCMLSVPSNTSDLHYSSWQSGENCQAVAAGAFTFIFGSL